MCFQLLHTHMCNKVHQGRKILWAQKGNTIDQEERILAKYSPGST